MILLSIYSYDEEFLYQMTATIIFSCYSDNYFNSQYGLKGSHALYLLCHYVHVATIKICAHMTVLLEYVHALV